MSEPASNQSQAQKAIDHGWLRLPPISIGPVHIHITGDPHFQEQVLQHLTAIEAKENKIMSQLDDANAAIAKIDAATTKSAASVDTMATITQQISDEVKALVAAGGVPQTVVDALNGIATKAQAVSDGLDSHSAFLQAIATQGATNPVPVPVPPPVTPAP